MDTRHHLPLHACVFNTLSFPANKIFLSFVFSLPMKKKQNSCDGSVFATPFSRLFL